MKLSEKATAPAVCGIAFAAYAAVLLLAFEKTGVLWLELACGAVASAIAAAALSQAAPGRGKAAFLAYPKAVAAAACAAVQLVFGLVASAIPDFPLQVAAIVSIVLLAICLVLLLVLAKAADHADRVDSDASQSTAFMHDLLLQLEDVQADAHGEGAEAIGKLAEAARYSDPVSSAATQEVEADLQNAVNGLAKAVRSCTDSVKPADDALKLIEKRARLCRSYKQGCS